MSKIEMLDLVDENDLVYDTKSRAEIYEKGLNYVRTADAMIVNSKGQFWIPIRTANKAIAPNGFDIGVGGHVEHGETYDQAFRKEVQEEADWDIDQLNWERVGKFGPNDGFPIYTMLYLIHSDIAPKLNHDDFVSAEWLYPDEIRQKVADGHPAKGNLLLFLDKLNTR